MTVNEYQNLKIGDLVVIKGGRDDGITCKVVYIDYDLFLKGKRRNNQGSAILVKSIDKEFNNWNGVHNKRLRLVDHKNIVKFVKEPE